ncbi:MAG: hypothetical protein ACRD4O_11175 [Bryobacteraceae bacterium]
MARDNVFLFGMRALVFISTLAMNLCLAFPARSQPSRPSLAIIGSGVQAEEDAPFVSPDYRFLPGDYVYFTFEITGFAVAEKEDEYADDVRSISLSYQVTPEDAAGTPLVPGVTGKIATALHPQDKTWTPKRRASFLLPSFLAAGAYRIHVSVRDALGKTETTRDFPFEIGGTQIKPLPAIAVENFRFLRSGNDTKPLEIPAYSPGDHIFARFEIAGYKLGPKNTYRVTYGITVFGPNGKPFIQQPNAAELESSSFYPAQFVPALLNLTTSRTSARGAYILVLRARDLVSGQSCEEKEAFSLE